MIKPCSPEAHAVAEANPRGLESEFEKKAAEIAHKWDSDRRGQDGGIAFLRLIEVIAAALDEAVKAEQKRCETILSNFVRMVTAEYRDPLPENNTPEAWREYAQSLGAIAIDAIRSRGEAND